MRSRPLRITKPPDGVVTKMNFYGRGYPRGRLEVNITRQNTR